MGELEKECGASRARGGTAYEACVLGAQSSFVAADDRAASTGRVAKELVERETELAEVLTDVHVHRSHVAEAADNGAVIARRLADVRSELDQALAMEQELDRQVQANGANVAQSMELLHVEQQRVRCGRLSAMAPRTRLRALTLSRLAANASSPPPPPPRQLHAAMAEETQFRQRLLTELGREGVSRPLT